MNKFILYLYNMKNNIQKPMNTIVARQNLKLQWYNQKTIDQIIDVVNNHGLDKEWDVYLKDKINFLETVFEEWHGSENEYLSQASANQLKKNQDVIQMYLRNTCRDIFLQALKSSWNELSQLNIYTISQKISEATKLYGDKSAKVRELLETKRKLQESIINHEWTIAWVNKLVNTFNNKLTVWTAENTFIDFYKTHKWEINR